MIEQWLRLLYAEGVGPSAVHKLLQSFPDPETILLQAPEKLLSAGLRSEQARALSEVDDAAIDRALEWQQAEHHHIISLDDPAYPQRLRLISSPPPLLFVIGDLDLLQQPGIGIVGSRNPTPSGRENARDFAHALASHGLCINSGLARGVDAAAHRGALEADGMTIAVAATGLDIVYPAENRDLAHRIAASGALVSEYPLGTDARAQNFPRRNRIISGLSNGVLVVEAALRSGSLITARYAAEQNRELFAIPGSIHSAQSRGCHQLIKQGAQLVESAEDILHVVAGNLALGPVTQTEAPEPFMINHEHSMLLESMGFDPISVDRLVEITGLTAEEVSSMLLIMELEGRVAAMSGGFYQRLKPRD